MTYIEIFLKTARDHLDQLVACPGPVVLGANASPHFQHAIACSISAATAVEQALSELIWVRCFFQTPEPYRRAAMQHARRLRRMEDKLAFLEATTKINKDVIAEMRKLATYRNRLVHGVVTPFEGKVMTLDEVEDEDGSEQDVKLALREKDARHLDLRPLSTDDLELAAENLEIADKAVAAILREKASGDWPVLK